MSWRACSTASRRKHRVRPSGASLEELVAALRTARDGRLTDAVRTSIGTGLDDVGRQVQPVCDFPHEAVRGHPGRLSASPLAPQSTATAAPVTDLCTPDGARGRFRGRLVLDACVDATYITLRNDRGVPVVVRRDGDLANPVPPARISATSSVLRMVLAGS